MSYHLLLPYQIINGASMGASFISKAQNIQNQDNVGLHLIWSGTPAGSFDFQVSDDAFIDGNGNIIKAGTWISLPLNPMISAQGTPDIAFVDFNQMGCIYLRIVYNFTSGSGTLNGYISAKGI